jgi:hypothetical protein
MGAGKAVKNLVTSPYQGIKQAVTDHQYDNIEEATIDQKKNGPKYYDVRCKRSSAKAGSDLGIFADLQDHIREQVCSCRPWGTCTTQECACEKLCPDNFDIFQRQEIEKNTLTENSLAFRNTRGIADNYEMTQGFCWGHASVTSKFNRLAFFKGDKKPPYDLNSPNSAIQDKAVKYYKDLIDKVVNNETVDIPGFKNLNELSDHPSFDGYLGDKVAESWGDRAMSFQGAGVALKSGAQSKKANKKFFNDVKKKIDLNQQPQIVFTKGGAKFMTHAVLVSHYKEDSNGNLTLCVRDNNYSPYSNHKCSNRMYLKPDGSVQYNRWGSIGGISVAHNDNGDALEQFKALKERCGKEKGCKK